MSKNFIHYTLIFIAVMIAAAITDQLLITYLFEGKKQTIITAAIFALYTVLAELAILLKMWLSVYNAPFEEDSSN